MDDRVRKWAKKGGDDVEGGWFIWAFREAVTSAGKYDTDMSKARDWYQQLALEIDVACRNGQLDCLPARSSLAPPWHNEYLPLFFNSLLRASLFLTEFNDVSYQGNLTDGNEALIERYERVTNEQIPRYHYQMTGLVGSRIGDFIYGVSNRSSRLVDADIKCDKVTTAHDFDEKGFNYWHCSAVTAIGPNADFILQGNDRQRMTVPIAPSSKEVRTNNLTWNLESYTEEPLKRTHSPLSNFRIWVITAIKTVYAALMPILAFVSLIILLRRFINDLHHRVIQGLTALILALLGAVAVRLLLLSYIDVSSFPAINVPYMSPVYPLYISAIFLVLIQQCESLLVVKHRQLDKATE